MHYRIEKIRWWLGRGQLLLKYGSLALWKLRAAELVPQTALMSAFDGSGEISIQAAR